MKKTTLVLILLVSLFTKAFASTMTISNSISHCSATITLVSIDAFGTYYNSAPFLVGMSGAYFSSANDVNSNLCPLPLSGTGPGYGSCVAVYNFVGAYIDYGLGAPRVMVGIPSWTSTICFCQTLYMHVPATSCTGAATVVWDSSNMSAFTIDF
jgi:hypothetical protein